MSEQRHHIPDDNAVSAAIARYRRAGFIAARRHAGWTDRHAVFEYRITDAGRAWLARRLETDMRVCSESEAA